MPRITKDPIKPNQKGLSVHQVADLLRRSEEDIYAMVRHGELRAVRIGSCRRMIFPRDEVEELAGRKAAPRTP